jgi:2-polyprenyl-3-methyl-5-hydroxy-6-metoxy-1,4-benzoquinol methylase
VPAFDARDHVGPTWFGAAIDPFDDPWFRFVRLLAEIERSIDVPRGLEWLDLGCHQGQFLKLVKAKCGVRPTGIDDWDPSLSSDDSWEYLQRNLADDFRLERRFGCVSALEVIEHIIDTDAFLDRIHHHLTPGGHLLLTTPNINSLRNRLTVPLGSYPAGLEYRNHIHHVRLYNAAALVGQLREHGFVVDWLRAVNALPVRMLRRGLGGTVDRWLANTWPQLCGTLMVLAHRTS